MEIMMKTTTPPSRLLLLMLITSCLMGIGTAGSSEDEEAKEGSPTRQAIIWTSGDPEVAHRMALMYAHAAKQNKWFDEVQLIVWGPSSRLLAADKDLQAKIKQMQKDGVDVKACIVCANSYGVTDDLRELGIEVKAMGKPLADLQHQGWHVLTF